MSNIVGVAGRKRSGKDTFAERLVSEHGFTRVAFADTMREVALALDPLVGFSTATRLSELVGSIGWERAKLHPEVRRTLQRLGTDAGRNILGEGIWVDAAMRKVGAIDGPVVITDVRFPNEVDAVLKAGGNLVKIERPGSAPSDPHPSETALDDYPFPIVIQNSGTVEDLKAYASKYLDYLTIRNERSAKGYQEVAR